MKKLFITLLFTIITLNSFSQLVQFTPLIDSPHNNGINNSHQNENQTFRTTAYVLNDRGEVEKKISIKVSVCETPLGERLNITAYYDPQSASGATWQPINIQAYTIGSVTPMTQIEQVAFANFNYHAIWGIQKIWFNL
jgi:hypothetical protein